MLRTPLLATATAAAALVLPAAAIAQSAGNDQYQDPLATGHHSTRGGSNTHGGGGSGTSGNTATAPQTTPTTPNDPSTHTTRASGRQLPRTGFDVILPVEVGLLLTLSGVTLQRLLVIQSRRR